MARALFRRVVQLQGPLAARALRYLNRIPEGHAPDRRRSGGKKARAGIDGTGRIKKKRIPARSRTKSRVAHAKRSRPTAIPIVRRTPHMEGLPDVAPRLGSTFSVDVYADTAAARPEEESEPIVLVGQPGQTRFDIDVWLAGSAHFQIADPKASRLVIDAASDVSTRARFTVSFAAGPPGESATLTAYFFYNGRSCGKVTRRLTIGLGAAATGGAGADTHGSLALDTTAAPPDLTIEITDPTRNRRSLHCRVTTPLLPSMEQPPIADWFLPDESPAIVAQFMKEFVKPDITRQARVLNLKGAGIALFEAAPATFKDTLWKLIDAGTPPRSILIMSEEPFIPWELMIPRRRRADGTREEREPLGVEFAVGRWVHEEYLSPRNASRSSTASSWLPSTRAPGPGRFRSPTTRRRSCSRRFPATPSSRRV